MAGDAEAKEPPYAADVRAKGWRFELDHERMRQSDTWVLTPPELRPWLLMLWVVAWEQTPCGSLPNDSELIAARIGMPAEQFRASQSKLMRGWTPASDGRLYHHVIVERVNEMLTKREGARARQEAWRKARHEAQPEGDAAEVTDKSRVPNGVSRVTNDTSTRTSTSEVSDEANASSSSPDGDGGPAEGFAIVGGKAASLPACPYDDIVDAYHKALPELPAVKLRDGKTWEARKRAMRERWRWVLTSSRSDGKRRAETVEQAMDWVRGFYGRVRDNDFLMGRQQRSGDHANWRCDFDFLLTERGLRQVIEKTR
jgi:hypothetical protein